MEAWFTYESFAPLVGAIFTARASDGHDVPLVLAEASDSGLPGGRAPDGRSRTQFSLVFRGPAELPLAQGMYEISAAAIGAQQIFVVPVRADAQNRYYEAVFA